MGTLLKKGWGKCIGAIALCFFIHTYAQTQQPSKEQHLWPRIENEWPYATPEFSAETYRLERLHFFGPLYEENFGQSPKMVTFRPIRLEYREANEQRFYLLPPLMSAVQRPHYKRWTFIGIVQSKTIEYRTGSVVKEGMFFPFYFYRDTGDPRSSYKALFPVAGKTYNFLGNDEMRWYLWPLWLYTRKRSEEHFSFPWPFIRWQRGPESGGWALWPITGHFYKNKDYDHAYRMWPLMYVYKDYHYKKQWLQDIPRIRKGFLPIYAIETTDHLRDVSFLWPFMGYRDAIRPEYHEWRFFWPLLVQGRGEVKYVNRWAPVYTHSIKKGVDKKWFLWPFLRVQNWNKKQLHIEQAQFLYFLIWHQNQRHIKYPGGPVAEKTHVWPLCSYWDNGAGHIQFQMFSPLAVFFQKSESVRDLYSPLFAVYRFEQPNIGSTRESLLFNFITEQRDPKRRQLTVGPLLDYHSEHGKAHFELLKGFLGYKCEGNTRTIKILWMEIKRDAAH